MLVFDRFRVHFYYSCLENDQKQYAFDQNIVKINEKCGTFSQKDKGFDQKKGFLT